MIARETAKNVPLIDVLARFDPSVRPAIQRLADKQETEAIVVLEVLQMDSSRAGDLQALAVGPSNSWTLDHVLDTPSFRTGNLPSNFHYPVAYWRK